MNSVAMIDLADAARAWDAGERALAFESLCGLWAQTTNATVAELCEQISEQLVGERVAALELEVGRERVLAELIQAARAADRVAVHALLPWLVGLARPKDRQQLVMLEVADPVLLRWLMLWHRRRPELNELAQYLVAQYTTWLASLHAWWDRDQPPDYDRMPRFMPPLLRTQTWPRPRSPRAASVDELAAVAALRERFEATQPATRTQARALLEAVVADPNDDARRAVLSDYLLAQDHADPRGELIALQLGASTGPLSDSARERERELLDEHGFRWLGPLWSICNLASVQFERGFLVGLDLRHGVEWTTASLAPGDPIWATVEEVNGASWAVVRHPIMRSLRALGCGSDCARRLLRGPVRPALERLTITWEHPFGFGEAPGGQRLTPSGAAKLLDNLEAVPNLRHLGIRGRQTAEPDAWRWLWQGPRASLGSLRLRVDEPLHVSAWLELLREDRTQVELRLDLVQLLFILDPSSEYRTLRVTHNVSRWRSFAAEAMFDLLVRTLAPTLSIGDVDRVEVDPRVCDVARLEATLRERARAVERWIVVSVSADEYR